MTKSVTEKTPRPKAKALVKSLHQKTQLLGALAEHKAAAGTAAGDSSDSDDSEKEEESLPPVQGRRGAQVKAFGRVRTDPSHQASVAELQAQQRKEMEQLREKNKQVLTSRVGEVL